MSFIPWTQCMEVGAECSTGIERRKIEYAANIIKELQSYFISRPGSPECVLALRERLKQTDTLTL